MLRRPLGLFLILVALGTCRLAIAQEQPATQVAATPLSDQDQAATVAVVKQFYNAGNFEHAMSFWSSKSPYREERAKRIQRYYDANTDIVVDVLLLRWTEVHGQEVWLRTSTDVKTSDPKTGKPGPGMGMEERIFLLVKEDGGWKIWRLQNASDVLAGRVIDARSDAEREALIRGDPYLPPELLGDALFRLGASFRAKGELAKARTSYRWMQTVAQRSGNRPVMSSALVNLGILSDMQGDHQAALGYFKEALKIAEDAFASDQKQISNALADIGIAYKEQGDYAEAMTVYKRALAIAESMGDRLTIADALNNVGEVYRMQGNTASALEYFQKSLDISISEKHDPSEIALALLDIGATYQDMGNGARALDYFQQSLAQLGKSQDARARMGTLANIGEVYQAQGAYEEALDYYGKSLALTTQLGDKDTEAAVTVDIGSVQQLQARYTDALQSYRRSLALDEETGNKPGIVEVQEHIGELQAKHGQYSEALATHQKALELAESLGLKPSIARICKNMAEEHFRRGEYKEQLALAQRATSLSRESGDLATRWQSRTLEGLALRGLNDAQQARTAFEEAITVAEELRNQVAGAETAQQGSFSTMLAPYYDIVELLIAHGQPGDALAYAERAKGRVLLDVLASGRVNITKAMNPAERETELHLKERLVSLNRQLQAEAASSKTNKERIRSLNSLLENTRLEQREFETAVYTSHPELRTKRGQFEPLTLPQAAGLLPDSRAALLEFLVAEKNAYLFVLTKKSGKDDSANVNIYKIPVTENDLENKTASFRQQLANRDLGFRSTSADLFKLLLNPAWQQLGDKTALIIVPDGPLWNLPFQALYSRQGRPMIETFAIAYAPSLTVLREMRHLRRSARPTETAPEKTLLAMGNPSLNLETVQRASFTYRDEKLEPLPEAAEEVKALGRIYGLEESEIQTGPDASEDTFKANAGRFRVLHLATHGVFNDASPMYSNLLLAPGKPDSKEDGLLEAWEIMQMDLRADLAVLSACETARGRVSAGEGVIGLTWAFFVAGVPTTVVSQWKVESSSTSKMMLSFHQGLKAKDAPSDLGFAKARALQRAELLLLHDPHYSHPFYWAGFVLIGDPQ